MSPGPRAALLGAALLTRPTIAHLRRNAELASEALEAPDLVRPMRCRSGGAAAPPAGFGSDPARTSAPSRRPPLASPLMPSSVGGPHAIFSLPQDVQTKYSDTFPPTSGLVCCSQWCQRNMHRKRLDIATSRADATAIPAMVTSLVVAVNGRRIKQASSPSARIRCRSDQRWPGSPVANCSLKHTSSFGR
jgi:hypothetical protein